MMVFDHIFWARILEVYGMSRSVLERAFTICSDGINGAWTNGRNAMIRAYDIWNIRNIFQTFTGAAAAARNQVEKKEDEEGKEVSKMSAQQKRKLLIQKLDKK